MSQYKEIAEYLVTAEVERREVPKVTTNLKPDLTVEEAYLVQEEIVNIKLNEGKRIIGPKMGLTSPAKMKQMGITDPIYGYVFDYMLVENGGKARIIAEPVPGSPIKEIASTSGCSEIALPAELVPKP